MNDEIVTFVSVIENLSATGVVVNLGVHVSKFFSSSLEIFKLMMLNSWISLVELFGSRLSPVPLWYVFPSLACFLPSRFNFC